MKIAVNLLPFRKRLGGAGQYAKNILHELSIIDNSNEYYLFMTREGTEHFETDKDNFHPIICPLKPDSIFHRIIWEQLFLPAQLKKIETEILFTPSVAIPFFCDVKKVTTIHDLAFKFYKKKYPFLRRIYISLITRISALKSDIILTVSKSSQKDIVKEYDLNEDNIIVAYNGVRQNFYFSYDEKMLASVKGKYAIPDNFIIYVGAIEPGKNLDKLLKAYAKISINKSDLKLLVTGGLGWQHEYFYRLLKENNIVSQVHLLPYIPDNELPIIYKLAKLLVYISPYEGFGIPVLEAMASGIPVLASEIPSIKEFADGYALLVDPSDQNKIENGMEQILSDNTFRVQMIRNQLIRSKEFTWRKSAEIILRTFNRLKQR